MTAIVTVQDLHKTFDEADPDSTVLRGLSFAMQSGEFLCIMGPSGSGKSTLLHIISGLDTPSSGRVELDGADLAGLSQRDCTLQRRAAVGHVFQFFNLMPNLNVVENVGLPLAIAGERPAEKRTTIDGLLARFGLGKKGASMPHQLSGGEMQRTSIARALAGGQPLLLCDEPTGNLSQSAGLEVMQALRQVCDEDGRSVLLVTHNPRDATFADRVLFLVDGALAEDVELEGPGIPVEDVHRALVELKI